MNRGRRSLGGWPQARCVRLAAVGLVAGTLLTGCGPSLPPADLVIINGAEPESLDPALALSVEDLRVTLPLFEGLTRNDPVDASPIPGLAESWVVSPDGRTYTFELRTNAAWSTGEPITAADVVYSWRRALDPATGAGYASQLFFLEHAEAFHLGQLPSPDALGLRALGSHRLEVRLTHPTPFFLDLCAFPTLAVVPRQTIEAHGDHWIRARPLPVSGPYQLDFWRLNDRVRLRRNPHYWDRDRTALEVVDLLTVGNPATAFNLYENGQADVIWDRSLVPAELLDRLRERPDAHPFDLLAVYFVRCNTTRAPLDDPRVRRALSLTIDRQRIVERITRGGEKPAGGLVPPATAHSEAREHVRFDPAAGRQLLAEAGYPQGAGLRPLRYLFWTTGGGTGQEHAKVAVELKHIWETELGLRIELDNREKRVFIAAQRQLDYDLSQSSWVADYNDPNTFLELFGSHNGNNRTGWASPRYDGWLKAAQAEAGESARRDLLGQAERFLIAEEAVVAPVYFSSGFMFFRPDRLAGIHPNALDVHPLNAVRRLSSADRR
jgi:oligopeptide transport system substrate-binding protein